VVNVRRPSFRDISGLRLREVGKLLDLCEVESGRS
jgi:hypothetical protein